MKKPTTALTDPREQKAEATVSTVGSVVDPMLKRWKNVTMLAEEDEYTRAADDLKKVKTMLEDIDRQRKELVDPLNGVVKKINAIFKPATLALSEWETKFKQMLIHYQDNKRQAVMLKAESEAKKIAKKSPQLAEDLINAVRNERVAPAVEGVAFRSRWTFRVTDETKVDRKWLKLDESSLQKYAEAMKDKAKEAGLEFYEEKIAAVSV